MRVILCTPLALAAERRTVGRARVRPAGAVWWRRPVGYPAGQRRSQQKADALGGVDRQATVTEWTLSDEFSTEANTEVLRFLRQAKPSAHPDVADELTRASAEVPGVQVYCPDPFSYAFVALHLEDRTIVGLAFGMSELAFRLPGERLAGALLDKGTAAAELGSGWIRFEPWSDHETLAESRQRMARWCSIAADPHAA